MVKDSTLISILEARITHVEQRLKYHVEHANVPLEYYYEGVKDALGEMVLILKMRNKV